MAGFRTVLDTNVVVAAHRSESPMSPNRDLLRRWRAHEFALLFSDDVLLEYIEKLTEFVADEAACVPCFRWASG